MEGFVVLQARISVRRVESLPCLPDHPLERVHIHSSLRVIVSLVYTFSLWLRLISGPASPLSDVAGYAHTTACVFR